MAVTKYMAIKWVKASFEIVVAIILIVFGNKILFGVFPEDAQEKSLFGLIVGLLWFLVIWCIIAAVRNIILSLRPEPKNSLRTLNEKIDALDKKLVTMGLASETVPEALPPSPQELKKGRNRKIMVAASIVAAVVLLAAISMVFLIPKMGGGGNPAGGATPEDTLNALITAMNARDANGVLSLTIYSFGNATEKSQFRQGINEMLNMAGASFHITKNSAQIKNSTDLNASENNDLTNIKNGIQNHISNTITAYCVIVYNMTVTIDNNNSYQDGRMPCFQINGGWYLLPDFGGGGPDGGGNQSQSPTDAFDNFIDRVKQKDETGAVDYSIFKFGDNTVRMKTEERISEWWNNTGTFQITVNSRYEINWSSMSFDQQNNLSGIQSNLSSEFGINVPIQDHCFIAYDITITNDTGSSTMTGFMPCFRTNNSWYVMPEQPGGGQQGISVAVNQGSTATNWTLTVDSVNSANPLYTYDVYLTIVNSTGVTNISVQLVSGISGTYMNGVTFNDQSAIGVLDPGDVFVLDNYSYKVGTKFKLTDSSGMQIYCPFFTI
jgi:hypothetical protein